MLVKEALTVRNLGALNLTPDDGSMRKVSEPISLLFCSTGGLALEN